MWSAYRPARFDVRQTPEIVACPLRFSFSPGAEQLAIALHEGFHLELRKAFAGLADPRPPHAEHLGRARVLEPVDEVSVMLEMLFEQGPLVGNRHSAISLCDPVPRGPKPRKP